MIIIKKEIYYSTWLPSITNRVLFRSIKYELLSKLNISNVPGTVSIEITRKYNNNCLNKFELDPSYNIIKDYIDQALDIGTTVITFTEGESLFNRSIYDLIRYVNKKKAIVNIFSWGLNFSYEIARLLKDAGLQTLFISIYSTNPKIHDSIRGINGSYYKAINAIKIAKKAGLIVTLTTHIIEQNNDTKLKQLYELYNLACKLEVDEFSIWEEIITIKNKRPDNIESINRILKFQSIKNKIQNKKVKVFTNLLFEKYIGKLSGKRWLHIDIEGNVHPDTYIKLSYGNLKKTSLKKCWNNILKKRFN